MGLNAADLHARARRIRLVLLDVDGVLTDGTVSIDSTGGESKDFFIRDGAAIVWAAREGLEVGLLSGRPSDATTRRAAELGIRLVVQGAAKLDGYREILSARQLEDEAVAYMADDLMDLPILARAGLSAAPADAVDEVQSSVHWVSRFPGGRGAVRELLELVLGVHGTWDRIVRSYNGR